jgi:hypothetical protein
MKTVKIPTAMLRQAQHDKAQVAALLAAKPLLKKSTMGF